MKSKISFINRTMLQKNVKLFWPIWTLYTIVLLLNGPVSMWSRFKNAEFIYGKNWHKYMLDIISPAISTVSYTTSPSPRDRSLSRMPSSA